jgi:hypothetical protein
MTTPVPPHDLRALLPQDKHDLARASALVELDFATIEPLLPELLEWMQDRNWPVTRIIEPFLAGVGAPLAPHIRDVLRGTDNVWKEGVVRWLVAGRPDLRQALAADLRRIAVAPTPGERAEELDELARELVACHAQGG